MRNLLRFLALGIVMSTLSACSVIGYMTAPNAQRLAEQRFAEITGHKLMDVYTKEDRLGYLYEDGNFIKKVWGGKVIVSPTGQDIKLIYTRENFDKLKLFLGSNFSIGPGLETVHHINVYFEDLYKYELVDHQPLIEYMGGDSLTLLKKKFVVSMLKASHYRMEAFKKIKGEFGTEFQPYPMTKVDASSGGATSSGDERKAFNIFVGCKLSQGKDWILNFDQMPKVNVKISHPGADTRIDRVRTRVRGNIESFSSLNERYKNKMWLYIMVRDEYEDDWRLQKRATINAEGDFEGVAHLGTLERGDGHRYSIAAFVTYFQLNRDVNSSIPILPFNKGKDVISVSRKDSF